MISAISYCKTRELYRIERLGTFSEYLSWLDNKAFDFPWADYIGHGLAGDSWPSRSIAYETRCCRLLSRGSTVKGKQNQQVMSNEICGEIVSNSVNRQENFVER